MTVLIATATDRLTEAFALYLRPAGCADAICVGSDCVAELARALVDDGGSTGVQDFLGDVLEGAIY